MGLRLNDIGEHGYATAPNQRRSKLVQAQRPGQIQETPIKVDLAAWRHLPLLVMSPIRDDPLTGFAEVFTGTIVCVRFSIAGTHKRPDPYQWSIFAVVDETTGKAEIQGFSKEPVPVTRENVDWVLNKIREAGFEPTYQRRPIAPCECE